MYAVAPWLLLGQVLYPARQGTCCRGRVKRDGGAWCLGVARGLRAGQGIKGLRHARTSNRKHVPLPCVPSTDMTAVVLPPA